MAITTALLMAFINEIINKINEIINEINEKSEDAERLGSLEAIKVCVC